MSSKKVVVDANEFFRSHGRSPKGEGWWAFRIGDGSAHDRGVWFAPASGFAKARSRAVWEARRLGVTSVAVLP